MAWMKATATMVIKTRQRPYRKEKKMQNYDAWKTSEPEEDIGPLNPDEDSAKLIERIIKDASPEKIQGWAELYLEEFYSKYENYNTFFEDWKKHMEDY